MSSGTSRTPHWDGLAESGLGCEDSCEELMRPEVLEKCNPAKRGWIMDCMCMFGFCWMIPLALYCSLCTLTH